MIDLTQITTPFGLLDKETQTALLAHGGPYEWFDGNSWDYSHPKWCDHLTYRVKPAPVTKPSIDWSHVAEGFDWLATDENGMSWLFKAEPRKWSASWEAPSDFRSVAPFASYRPGTCDWRDSLVRRPGK